MMEFRENLKSELTFKDIRVKELAEKTCISKKTLDNYLAENGCKPSAENAVKIASVLGVSVEWLVTGKTSATTEDIKPEVTELMRRVNYLQESDINLLKIIVGRLEKKYKIFSIRASGIQKRLSPRCSHFSS